MCFGLDEAVKTPRNNSSDVVEPEYCMLHISGLQQIFDIADQHGYCAASRELSAKSYRMREIAGGGRAMFEKIMPTLALVNEDVHIRAVSSSADGKFVVYLETADPSKMADGLSAVNYIDGEPLARVEKGEGMATVVMKAKLDAVIAGTEGVNIFEMIVHIYDPEQIEVAPVMMRPKAAA